MINEPIDPSQDHFMFAHKPLTPTANNDIASAFAFTVMSSQYVSIVPEWEWE